MQNSTQLLLERFEQNYTIEWMGGEEQKNGMRMK